MHSKVACCICWAVHSTLCSAIILKGGWGSGGLVRSLLVVNRLLPVGLFGCRLVAWLAEKRCSAAEALEHPWLGED